MKPGYSMATVKANALALKREGHANAAAWRKAYENARECYRKKYPNGHMPDHLATPEEKARRAAFKTPYKDSHHPRKNNPVPASKRLEMIEQGADLYEKFSGHDAEEVGRIDKPTVPDVMVAIGECDGLLYSTLRDGKLEKYIHKFKKSARPMFCVSPDGSALFLIGGLYDFTERGIVDR